MSSVECRKLPYVPVTLVGNPTMMFMQKVATALFAITVDNFQQPMQLNPKSQSFTVIIAYTV